MGLLNQIQTLLDREQHAAFRRWSATELAEKKFYLENKPPATFNPEDYYLLVEWLYQRYLPPDYEPSPQQWASTVANFREKIDANIKKAAAGELVVTELTQERRYVLSKADFKSELVPAFANYDLLPDPYQTDLQGIELWEHMYEFTTPYSYRHGEAKDALMPYCDTYRVTRLITDLARTYTAIRNAKLNGSAKMKVRCLNEGCASCMSLEGKKLSVTDLLNSFKQGAPIFPHAVKAEMSQGWCQPPILTAEIPLRPNDDPEFHEYLLKLLER